jgi:putative addiction module component (TIGR02574 family)
MAVTIQSLGIDQLSIPERLDLMEQIWDSLPEQVSQEEVPDWHLAELAVRRGRVQTTGGECKPWREALQHLERSK